jgi:methyl-accepting chemotaxis protein
VGEIGSILSVIEEVTSQTNLLALNAAIIAAQSGDHGKGFMVVADEMKELADRTDSSTREIAEVIKGVQREAGRAVEAIASAGQSIEQGELLSRKSGDVLNKIVADVKLAGERVDGIVRATKEQSKGSGMIREAIEQVSQMASQIARATSEQGRGSELIAHATERMKDLTAQVRRSTLEQSKVGNAIARATENITDMIARIKDACDEQAKGSERIVMATTDIHDTSGTNLGAARIMDEAVASLTRQIEMLEQEVAGFRVLES